jgi:hypothetical protein
MSTTRWRFVSIVALLSVGAASAQPLESLDKLPTAELANAKSVGREVQRALQRANATGLSGLRVSEAVLKLETGSETVGDAGFDFVVFTVQHKGKKAATQSTELAFSLPKTASITKADLAEPLARAIAAAAATAAQINVLTLTKATVTLEFAVSKDDSGRIGFTVLGTKLGGGVDLATTSKNTLVVTFSR